MSPLNLPIFLTGGALAPGETHPMRLGIPFPPGAITQPESLRLYCGDRPVTADATPLLRWPDGSVQWMLLRFLARGEHGPSAYRLSADNPEKSPGAEARLRFSESDDGTRIDTGRAVFTVAKDFLRPFQSVAIDGIPILAAESEPVLLRDAQGKPHRFRIHEARVEHHGATGLELKLVGAWTPRWGKELCRAVCRLHFFADTALVKMEGTLWNPKAARHRGGLWDLGDPGSVFFRSLSFPFAFRPAATPQAWLTLDADTPPRPCQHGSVHQNSSGFPGWQSPAHVDKDDRLTVKFRGWRGDRDGEALSGDHSNPAAMLHHDAGAAAFALEHFWEAFPNRIDVSQHAVSLEPFPAADGQEFELQGGEKATFTLWADFAADPAQPVPLRVARAPLTPVLDPAWVAACGCLPYSAAPGSDDPFYAGLQQAWIEGDGSLFARRAAYEEFGWRNFGEVPADHEKLHYHGMRPLVSHYNNQYDLIQSFWRKFLETGDGRWRSLAADLCLHVINHDIYHTAQDKAAYNGGYFWHTAHYRHAGTATHRTYSRRATDGPPPRGFGGGPSNEHNYTSGLLLHYALTGETEAREAVLELAGWVRDMQDGRRTPFRFFSRNPTGLATCTRFLDFQGPGRGGAYSVNTCLDAFTLAGDRSWMELAERTIAVCIHPEDDCDALDLLNRENRWSYVVFLQVLGKYLEVKWERRETDAAFAYAQASLIHYARWMAAKEFPALWKPDQLEFATSTWAAQDLRKTEVFLLAARFGDAFEEKRFLERAEFFYGETKQYLARFDDKGCVRNMAILLHCLPACRQWRSGRLRNLGLNAEVAQKFPPKIALLPQKIQAIRNARRFLLTLGMSGFVRILRGSQKRARGSA